VDGSERHRQHCAAHQFAEQLSQRSALMATIPNPAAMLAPALPFPLESGQLLAFAGPSYPPQGGEGSIATDAVQTIGTGVEPLVSGPLPPVATVPPIGGFAPFEIARAAEGLIEGAKNAAGQVLDFISQLWGALNNRTTTPGTPATYSRGAYTGSYNPNSNNRMQLQATGIRYFSSGSLGDPYIEVEWINHGLSGNEIFAPGYRIFIQDWPDIWTVTQAGREYTLYSGYPFPTDILYTGPGEPPRFFANYSLNGLKSDAQIVIKVTPENPNGAIPYFPDVPAVPPMADPVVLVPVIAVTAKAAQVLPATTTSPKKRSPHVAPPLPQLVPGVAPLVEVAPSIGGAARQITTATGTLRKLTPAEVPRIPPLPARPVPGLQRETTPAGQTLPAPVPAPATTPTDLRKYGPQTVTSIGVRPDLVSIAAEVGRIEQKTGRMLQDMDKTPDWFDSLLGPLLNQLKNAILDALVVDVPAITYGFEAPCDKDGEGNPVVHESDIEAADYQPAIVARLDAIAEAMGVLKGWKTPTCRVNPPQSNVTVTAEEFDPEA